MLEATIGLAARERPSSGAAGGGSRGSPTRLPRDSTDAEASPRRSDRPLRQRSRPEGDTYDVSARFKGSVQLSSGSDESDDDAAENAQRDGKGAYLRSGSDESDDGAAENVQRDGKGSAAHATLEVEAQLAEPSTPCCTLRTAVTSSHHPIISSSHITRRPIVASSHLRIILSSHTINYASSSHRPFVSSSHHPILEHHQ